MPGTGWNVRDGIMDCSDSGCEVRTLEHGAGWVSTKLESNSGLIG